MPLSTTCFTMLSVYGTYGLVWFSQVSFGHCTVRSQFRAMPLTLD